MRRPDGVTASGRQEAADQTHPWRACVRHSAGQVAGAGVLVDRWHVLTSAQVAAWAIGEARAGAAPVGELVVHFPFWRSDAGATGWRVSASVPPYGWVPPTRDGRGDLALLQLRHPVPMGLTPARLDGVRDRARRPVRVFGHLVDGQDGDWLDVRVHGDRGSRFAESVSVEIHVDRPVERAFVGGGVLDELAGTVVGVIVADLMAPGRARLIGMEAVVRHLTHLAPLLGGEVGPVGPVASGAARSSPTRPTPSTTSTRAPQRRLSDTEWQTLFTRFWAVPAMPSRSGRDHYLEALERRLGGRLTVGRLLDDVMDGWAILFALLDRPGSMRVLAGLIRGMHPDHPAVARFVEFVELSFPDLLLEHAERVELEGRLMGVGWTRIGAAHRFATRRFGVLPTIAPTTTGEVIRDLESRGRSPGDVPALLVMVDELAHVLGGQVSLELHRWSDSVADRLGLARAERRRLCDDADRRHARPVPAYLVVVLTADGVDRDRFLLSAVVLVGDEPERVVFRDDVARTLAEIEATLDDEVLPLVPEAVGGEVDGLVIEFVVPDRLLDTPFERWLFDRNGFARAIGLRYPVVARSRDRIEDSSVAGLWRAKTRWVQERGHHVGPRTVHHVRRDARVEPAPPDEGTGVFTRLVDVEEAVVLAVPFPPDTRPGAPADVFVAGLRAGVPAIVWARVATDPEGFRRIVDAELLAEGPADLPRQVWKYRLRHPEAINPGAVPSGTDPDDDRPPLGLVFGEATRIPNQLRRIQRFRAPGSGQGPGGSR